MSDEGSSPILVLEGPVRHVIALLDLWSVHHHEEVVPELLRALTAEIERDGRLKHPIIVDAASRVVLDGTHRVEALKALGCRWVAACLVDYRDPRITLGCWYRTFRGASGLEHLVEHLRREAGLEVVFCREVRPEEVGKPPTALALTDGRQYARVLADFKDKWEAWALVKVVERALASLGLEIGFQVEEDAFEELSRGRASVVLMTPRLAKDDVVEVALSGRVFPYKATRHVVPARPLFLNVPLRILRADRPLGELEAEVRCSLAKRRLRRCPPGMVIEGRRYEEEVFIFE